MRIDFPPDIDEINVTDFDILRCLYQNGPLWKMEISRQIKQRRSEETDLIEKSETISKQAVSRRVEELHRRDYLESSIIPPEKTEAEKKPKRKLIRGYRINEKGEITMRKVLKSVLRDTISAGIGGEEVVKGCNKHVNLYSELSEKDIDSLEDFVKTELETDS